jgi:hypothetical protein
MSLILLIGFELNASIHQANRTGRKLAEIEEFG